MITQVCVATYELNPAFAEAYAESRQSFGELIERWRQR